MVMSWPGEKLLIRLWETIEKSGAGLMLPWQMRRVGVTEAEIASHRILVIAAAEKQVEKMRAGDIKPTELLPISGVDSNVAITTKIDPTFNFEKLAKNFSDAQVSEHLRKEINIEKSIAQAEQVLRADESEPPERTVDVDWFFRWRECAAGVTSDSLQQLWGSVLASELKAPGLFAYRTLDFLRNLTPEEAGLIERLATVIVEDTRLIHGLTLLPAKKYKAITSPVNENELRLLEELGILAGIAMLGYFDEKKPFPAQDGEYIHLFACKGRGILAATDDPDKATRIGFYQLTKLGRNVLQLVQAAANEDHLIGIGNWLIQDGFKVQIGDVIDNGNGTRRFENGIVITLPEEDVS
jgi:hypothetical protein